MELSDTVQSLEVIFNGLKTTLYPGTYVQPGRERKQPPSMN